MAERPSGLAPGARVGALTINSLLGEGGFGAVYRAIDDRGRACAVKVSNVASERLRAPQLAWQQNELEALTRLRHPALVQVEGYGITSDGFFYLVLELVEGTRLDQYALERGRIDSLEAVRLGRRIAEGLAYCHAHSVFHLDLTPHNIIVTNPAVPTIKILDFGLAQVSEATGLEQSMAGVGTLGYAPPERYVKRPTDYTRSLSGAKQDLYSLGCILFSMLTGHRVFESSSREDMVWKLITCDAPSVRLEVPSVPEPLAALIASLLQRSPAQRFASAALLSTELKDLYYTLLRGDSAPVVRLGAGSGRISEESAFTGRTREFDVLRDAAAEVAAGGSAHVLLVGEAGIGKSRLVSEMLVSCIRDESVVIHGRSRHIGQCLPYAALREVLGQLATTIQRLPGERGQRVRAAAASVLATEGVVLRALAPEFEELATSGDVDGSPDLSGFRLSGADRVARAIQRIVAAVASEAIVIVTLEDLHWADDGTLAVLRKMLAELPPARAMFLLTSRVGADLGACRAVTVLELQQLAPEHNDQLLLELTGAADRAIIDALKDAIPLLTAGNPLFNTRVIRDLEQLGHLRYEANGGLRVDFEALRQRYTPPDSVSTLLEHELLRLPLGLLEILGAAAMLGRHFRVSELCSLGLYQEADVQAAVAEAERLRLSRMHGDACSFVHDTIREYVYRKVPDGRARELHAAIARQLSAHGSASAELAHHLEHAGDHKGASAAYFTAGRDADRLHDPHGARRHLGCALQLMAGLAPDQREPAELARVLHELVRVGCVFGKTDDTLQILESCAALLPEPSPEVAAAVHSSYARLYYVQGQMPKAAEHSAAALSKLQNDPRARSYHCLPANVVGRALCVSGRFAAATDMLTRGCELASEAGEYTELSHSLGLLGVGLGFTGAFDEALVRSEACVRLSQRLNDPVRIVASHVYNSALAESRFDWQAGVRETTELLAFAEDNSIGGLYLYVGTGMAGRHQFHIGQLERARILLTNALAMSRELGIVMLLAWTHAFLGDVHFAAGRPDDARTQYDAGLKVANASNDDYAGPLCLLGLAHLGALRGDPPATVRGLGDAALDRLASAGNVSTRVIALQRYAMALTRVGETGTAAELDRERDALVERLGLRNAVMWPDRTPAGGRRASDAPAAFQATERVGVDLVTKSGQITTDLRGPPLKLIDSLSTIEGFLPRFLEHSND